VSDALATLPWVEQGSIKADRGSRTVVFGINDKSQFNMDKIGEALGSRYGKGIEQVSMTEPKPDQSTAHKAEPAP
jgi:hypothetical protein